MLSCVVPHFSGIHYHPNFSSKYQDQWSHTLSTHALWEGIWKIHFLYNGLSKWIQLAPILAPKWKQENKVKDMDLGFVVVKEGGTKMEASGELSFCLLKFGKKGARGEASSWHYDIKNGVDSLLYFLCLLKMSKTRLVST